MSAPVLTPIGRRRWRTVGSWTGHGVTVPDGFTTDLASFPAWCEPIMARNELHWIVAGVIHDWHYRTMYRSRIWADARLRDIARAEGAPLWQCWVVWAAVRLFGRPAWNQGNTRRSEV